MIPNAPASVAFEMAIDDLFALASDTLESELTNDEQEAGLADLLDQIRTAEKDAEAKRKAEKQPHLDAGRAVDAAWKIGLDKAALATAAIKRKLTPYREAKQREKEEAARKAREEADALLRAAQAKHTAPEHLQAEYDAEQEMKAAAKLVAQANKIDRSATGLRTHWEAEVTDLRAAIIHYMHRSPERFTELVNKLADEDARGSRGTVPGVTFHERKKAA